MKKEYTFQCLISYEAETEEEARKHLRDDLESNRDTLFDCVVECPICDHPTAKKNVEKAKHESDKK